MTAVNDMIDRIGINYYYTFSPFLMKNWCPPLVFVGDFPGVLSREFHLSLFVAPIVVAVHLTSSWKPLEIAITMLEVLVTVLGAHSVLFKRSTVTLLFWWFTSVNLYWKCCYLCRNIYTPVVEHSHYWIPRFRFFNTFGYLPSSKRLIQERQIDVIRSIDRLPQEQLQRFCNMYFCWQSTFLQVFTLPWLDLCPQKNCESGLQLTTNIGNN